MYCIAYVDGLLKSKDKFFFIRKHGIWIIYMKDGILKELSYGREKFYLERLMMYNIPPGFSCTWEWQSGQIGRTSVDTCYLHDKFV